MSAQPQFESGNISLTPRFNEGICEPGDLLTVSNGFPDGEDNAAAWKPGWERKLLKTVEETSSDGDSPSLKRGVNEISGTRLPKPARTPFHLLRALSFGKNNVGINHVLAYNHNTAQNQVEANLGGSFVRETPCISIKVRTTLT